MIKTGLEVLIENIDKYKNRRIALIANQTSVTHDFIYSWDILKRKGLNIKRIFSPEHGLFSTEQDQIAVDIEPVTGCEIVSLYGHSYNSLVPDAACLDDIDLVLFDIQDIGTRYYTYVNTMALFMKAVDGRDIEFIVLDRPNPLGGIVSEGPMLEKEFESFVGVFDVPVRHGMTAGELAVMYKKANKLNINLSVIKMRGCKRKMHFSDTGLAWIPPSPNMPTEYAAFLYPGMCLIEGTNLSEGRGTTSPFCYAGALYIKSEEFAVKLNSYNLPGIIFRPVYFKPTFNKYKSQVCGGVFLHITDLLKFESFITGVSVVKAAYDLYKNDFAFLKVVYEFNDRHHAFDLLTGSDNIRQMILSGCDLSEIQISYTEYEKEFSCNRKEFEMYV